MRSIQLTDHVCPRPSSRGSATELVVKENRYEQTEARHRHRKHPTNRFGGHAAQWIEDVARRCGDFEVELIDLKDYPMPLFAEEASPLYAPSKDEVAGAGRRKSANSTPLSSRLPNTIADRPRF
jgi:hypothetical protein